MIRRTPRATRTDTLCPYTTLIRSDRLFTIYFKDLSNGKLLADTIEGSTGDAVWAADNKTLFYVKPEAGTLRSRWVRSEAHPSELQSLMRISYAVFCLKKQNTLSYILKYHLP